MMSIHEIQNTASGTSGRYSIREVISNSYGKLSRCGSDSETIFKESKHERKQAYEAVDSGDWNRCSYDEHSRVC